MTIEGLQSINRIIDIKYGIDLDISDYKWEPFLQTQFTFKGTGKIKRIVIKRIKISLKQYLKNDFYRRNRQTY